MFGSLWNHYENQGYNTKTRTKKCKKMYYQCKAILLPLPSALHFYEAFWNEIRFIHKRWMIPRIYECFRHCNSPSATSSTFSFIFDFLFSFLFFLFFLRPSFLLLIRVSFAYPQSRLITYNAVWTFYLFVMLCWLPPSDRGFRLAAPLRSASDISEHANKCVIVSTSDDLPSMLQNHDRSRRAVCIALLWSAALGRLCGLTSLIRHKIQVGVGWRRRYCVSA